MSEWPWAWPRKADMMHTERTAGERAITHQTAFSLLMMKLDVGPASTDMQKALTRPITKKVKRDTRKTFCTWFSRPRAWASEMVLERATGRPAVEMVKKKL